MQKAAGILADGKFIPWNELDTIEHKDMLKSLNIPYAESVIFPSWIKELCANCFRGMYIETVTISENIEDISLFTFDYSGVQNINVDINNPYYSSENGILFNKDKTILIKYPPEKKDKNYIIPDSVKKIHESAFFCNRYLENIRTKNVEIIGQYAFSECDALKEIIFSNALREIGAEAFSECPSIEKILFPSNLKQLGARICESCVSLKCVNLPKSLTYVGNNPFKYCYKLKEINYTGTEEEFYKIHNGKQIYNTYDIGKIKLTFDYKITLDELIQEGKSLKEANEILKSNEQQR